MADEKAEDLHRFPTGAVRGSDPGLARRELVPVVGWRRMAEACGYGVDVKGYPVGNWTKGIPSSNLLRHALDHIAHYIDGDRSEDHLGHAMWNLAVTAHNEERRPDMHDVGPLRQIVAPEPEAVDQRSVPESRPCAYCGEPHGPDDSHSAVPPAQTDQRTVPESRPCAGEGDVVREVFPPDLPADSFGRRCREALEAAGIPFAEFSEVNGGAIFRWLGPTSCRFHAKRHMSPSGVSVEDWDYPKTHGDAAAGIQRALEFQGLWGEPRRTVPEGGPCADSGEVVAEVFPPDLPADSFGRRCWEALKAAGIRFEDFTADHGLGCRCTVAGVRYWIAEGRESVACASKYGPAACDDIRDKLRGQGLWDDDRRHVGDRIFLRDGITTCLTPHFEALRRSARTAVSYLKLCDGQDAGQYMPEGRRAVLGGLVEALRVLDAAPSSVSPGPMGSGPSQCCHCLGDHPTNQCPELGG